MFAGVDGNGSFFGTGLTPGDFAGKVLAHGMVGGVMSVLQGGKFGHGFAAAGVSQSFAGKINGMKSQPARVATSAAIGGTVSEMTGGKFGNGATTAAFGRLFNEEMHEAAQKGTIGGGVDKLLGAAYAKARGYRVHANEKNSAIGVGIVSDDDGNLSLSPASHRIPVDGVYANPNNHAPTILDVDATKAIYVLETTPHSFYQKGYYGRDYQWLSNAFDATVIVGTTATNDLDFVSVYRAGSSKPEEYPGGLK